MYIKKTDGEMQFMFFSLFTGFSKPLNLNENFYRHLYISERAEITPTELKDLHKYNKIQKTKYR